MNSHATVHPRAAFGHFDFRQLFFSRFLSIVAYQMTVVVLAQFIYEQTHNPLNLGYIGLALFFPRFCLGLLAGYVADHFDRRVILLSCRLLQCISVVGIILFLHWAPEKLWVLYILLFLVGGATAFDSPASQSIVTQIVPTEHFSNAVKWNGIAYEASLVLGPALGGFLYGVWGGPIRVLYGVALLRFFSMLLVGSMKIRAGGLDASDISWKSLLAGIQYIRKKRVILGTISLDLFAVLFGGAVALMPVFANDILHVGPSGLGLLRAAPAVGAALMALAMAYGSRIQQNGRTMLVCVMIFGAATILFGLSRNFYFSLLCLSILGAADMVSVVIRGVMVQMETPPHMRGRVSAINFIFIGASNELGEFESGLTASWFGTVPAVLVGGLSTLGVVFLWNRWFPELGKYTPGRGSQ